MRSESNLSGLIDRKRERERKRIRMEETSSLGNFHANGSTRVFGAVILFFESKQAYPYPQIPLAMIDTGFLEHACVVQPHEERERESSIGVAGTGGERAMATRQEGSSTLPPQSLLRH